MYRTKIYRVKCSFVRLMYWDVVFPTSFSMSHLVSLNGKVQWKLDSQAFNRSLEILRYYVILKS